MTIGANIRQLRQEQDVTQEQLAEALGITSRAVSQWENDRTYPDISQLPALANFFDVTTDRLLGVDIRRKEEEIAKILKQVQRFQEKGDQESTIDYLREQIKIYPNEPALLSRLADALQCLFFHQEKADTKELKKEKSDEIIALCERALKYYDPNEDNSFPKQLLIIQYTKYMNEKEKAKEIIESLPHISCTKEMFAADVFEGKEALARRQSALLISFAQMIHGLFWAIYHDDIYTYEQKIEIIKADDAMIGLITGGKPNWLYGTLSINAVTHALYLLKLGDEEKALDMLETAYKYADSYETRPDGGKYAPCWLSELDDKREYIAKTHPDTAYDSIYNIITYPENDYLEALKGNERFDALMDRLKEKISR